MFFLMKELRALSLDELADLLYAKAEQLETDLPWTAIDTWGIHSQNRRHVRNLLARMTSHIELESDMVGPGFDDYIRRTGKDPFDIEHIWADKSERHRDEFGSDQDFAAYRNRLGDLLLVPASFNRSYGADAYADKLEHYLGQNLLAKSLHPLAYEHHPGFARYIERAGLPFECHEAFWRADLDQRQELYRALCEQIFSTRRFLLTQPQVAETGNAVGASAEPPSVNAAPPPSTRPATMAGTSAVPNVEVIEPSSTPSPGAERWHGTTTGYVNHKCRCERCRAAWARYHSEYRRKRWAGQLCSVAGCDRAASPSIGNGLCAYHHAEKQRTARGRA